MWTPSAVLALDESVEIQDFRPARGSVQDPIQVFSACIYSLADAVKEAQDYTFGIPSRLLGKMLLSQKT